MKTSDEIDKISEAFAIAQGEFKPIEKNKENPHFKSKFADLSSILLATREALSKNGLSITQSPTFQDNRINVISRLLHKSGQWVETNLSIKPIQDTAQAIGSAVTYGRRYGISALLGVCADDDDDGNEASKKTDHRNFTEKSRSISPQIQNPLIISKNDRIKKMIHAFNLIQINQEELCKFIKKPIDKWDDQDISEMVNIYADFKSGKMDKDDFLIFCDNKD